MLDWEPDVDVLRVGGGAAGDESEIFEDPAISRMLRATGEGYGL